MIDFILLVLVVSVLISIPLHYAIFSIIVISALKLL